MGRLLTQPLAHCVDRPGDGRPEPIQGRALLGLIFVSWVPGERQNASKEAVMTDRPTTEPPIGVPEADLLEQRATIDWPELPVDQVTVPGLVTDRMAAEGDLLEQAQAAGAGADDDRPHDSPALRE
jgi:hypothetical protein